MSDLIVRARPRAEPAETELDEAPAELEEERADAPAVKVKGGASDRSGRWDMAGLLAVSTITLLVGILLPKYSVAQAVSLSVFLGCLVHLLTARPLFLLARRFAREHQRLKAALTCPYCRDQLPEDEAMVCDRKGCGAFYHVECWEEIRPTYGGCAIYGCGSTTARLVGPRALQRHLIRLVVAATLFPPRIVKRIRERERQTLREVWQEARNLQEDISRDIPRSLGYGLLNLMVCLLALWALLPITKWNMVFILPILILPLLLLRMPLVGSFSWALCRLVARVFQEELAALGRADEGTFLARLANYQGK